MVTGAMKMSKFKVYRQFPLWKFWKLLRYWKIRRAVYKMDTDKFDDKMDDLLMDLLIYGDATI
jgi:hypothetical protein